MIFSQVGHHIKPLTLPMACTLNGFKSGSTYRFRCFNSTLFIAEKYCVSELTPEHFTFHYMKVNESQSFISG